MESDHLMHRENAWIKQVVASRKGLTCGTSGPGGGFIQLTDEGGDEAPDAGATTAVSTSMTLPPPPSTVTNPVHSSLIKTNWVALNALREPATAAAPLEEFEESGHTADGGGVGHDADLAQRLVSLLSRAPYRLLPTFRLRIALGLEGKGRPQNVWLALKNQLVAQGTIEEVRFGGIRGAGGSNSFLRGQPGKRTQRIGVRLLIAPGEALRGNPPRVSLPPLVQVSDLISASGTKGCVVSDLRDLVLHPKHLVRILEDLHIEHGFLRRPEQLGRTKAWRYFAPGTEADDVVAAKDAQRGHRKQAVPKGTQGRTIHHEQRLTGRLRSCLLSG